MGLDQAIIDLNRCIMIDFHAIIRPNATIIGKYLDIIGGHPIYVAISR